METQTVRNRQSALGPSASSGHQAGCRPLAERHANGELRSIGEVLAELLAQYCARFPELRVAILEAACGDQPPSGGSRGAALGVLRPSHVAPLAQVGPLKAYSGA